MLLPTNSVSLVIHEFMKFLISSTSIVNEDCILLLILMLQPSSNPFGITFLWVFAVLFRWDEAVGSTECFKCECDWPQVFSPLTTVWEYFRVVFALWPTVTCVSLMQQHLQQCCRQCICAALRWTKKDLQRAFFTPTFTQWDPGSQ